MTCSITKPGIITAISEDNFNLYFATENGVYRYDKNSEDFQYDYALSVHLDSSEITHFYFDRNRGYFWVVHRGGISYKSSISSIWREMSLVNSGIFSYYEIDDIGSSPEYFWIRSGEGLYPFDPFSALPVQQDVAVNEVDFINWGHSNSGISGEDISISPYVIAGDWTVGINNIKHKDGMIMNVTVYMEDNEGNKWFGTDRGYILKSWRSSFRLELITFGLPFDNVTEAFHDKEGNWWFTDSQFKRTGQLSLFGGFSQSRHTPFITQWYEADNKWTYYLPNESVSIEHTDVNSILRIGSTMYFGTMFGLLYLDLYNRDWDLIDGTNGLNDEAVWDMVEHEGSIYVATAMGINEISIANHIVIPDNDKRFEELIRFNIYDMETDSNYMYLATDAGLLRLDWKDGEISTLSKKNIKNIRLKDGKLTGSDGSIWSIYGVGDEDHIIFNAQNYDICGSFVWSSQKGEATLLDTITAQSWTYNYEDGIPGNKIYNVNCDEEWVWFLTNKGVAFYNWSKYHKKN